MDNTYENIVPWNGEKDTGYDVRKKWQNNFDKIKSNFVEMVNNGITQNDVLLLMDNLMKEIEGKYLSSQDEDSAKALISFLAGAVFGENGFFDGPAGYGAKIDKGGNAVFRTLKVYDYIWATVYRFNRIEVISGELWNSIAFGTIKSVDTANQIIELDLDENEWGTVSVDDICRAIFNNTADVANANSISGIDSCGFPKYKGYYTSYFAVKSIITNEAGKCSFYYTLRDNSAHPAVNMKFSVYGNFTDTNRQANSYMTRTYTRYMRNVNTWIVSSVNIALQSGVLDGLSFIQTDGSTRNLSGVGLYADGNVYLNGAEIQLSNAQLKQIADQLGSATTYSVHLSQNAATLNVNDDGYPEKDLVIVTKDADGKVTSSEYLLRSTLFAYKGSDILLYDETSGTSGAYSVVLQAKGCTADFVNGTVRILSIAGLNDGTSSYDQATMKALKQVSVDVQVSCEGEVILTQTFTVVVNHVASIYRLDLSNEASTINCDKDGKVVGQFETSKATVYKGGDEDDSWSLTIDDEDGASAAIANGTVTVASIAKDVTSIRVKAVKEGFATMYAVYTITKVYAGADGSDAVSYRLVPSVSAIKINKSGVHSVTSMSCGLTRATGAKLEALTSLPTGVKMQYSIDNGANYTDYTFGSVVNVSSATVAVIFSVYNTTNYYNFDVETIPVLIDGTDGTDGKDGDTTQYIFCRTTNNTAPSTPAYSDADSAPTGWTLSPSGVSASYPYEWISQRTKSNGTWSDFTAPAVFSRYGSNGNDGQNGTFRQSIFMLSNTQPSTPTTLNAIPTGWSTAPQTAAALSPSYSGAFLLKGLFRVSQTVADSGYAMDKVSFTTTQANQKVVLKLVVSSETNHDYAYIGNIDVDYSGVPASYYQRYSGSSSVEEVITVAAAGSHFIEVVYAKDSSSSQGSDNVKYCLYGIKIQWTSSAQATWTSGAWVYDAWTVPVQYLPDSNDTEVIFRRSTYDISSETPVSDELKDGFLPPVTDSFTLYDSTLSQTSGVFYKYNDTFYKCIQSRSANSSIAITDAAYFILCQDWTDNANGISETVPYEFISRRHKSGGKWGAFSAPAMYAKFSKGDTGPIPYPAGAWSATYNYVKTSTTVPFVLYEGSYYYLDAASSTGDTPSATSTVWMLFNMLKWVFTNILFADFGKLASAVFLGNYMFSQQGIDAGGNATSSYQNFTDENGTAFVPNFLVNFLTGLLKAKNVDLEGIIRCRALYTPFKSIDCSNGHTINPLTDGTNIHPTSAVLDDYCIASRNAVTLPDPSAWDGLTIRIYVTGGLGRTSSLFTTAILSPTSFGFKGKMATGISKLRPPEGLYQFTANNGIWYTDDFNYMGPLVSLGLVLNNHVVTTASETLDKSYDDVTVNYSNDCTLYLPSDCDDGKVIEVHRICSAGITLDAGSGKFITAKSYSDTSDRQQTLSFTSWGSVRLVYYSSFSTWFASYSKAM